MTIDRSTLTRYREPTARRVLGLTAVLCMLDGLAMVYQAHLSSVYSQRLSLSAVEWVAFVLGPFIVDPVLLFGVLYAVRSRQPRALSVTELLPALAVTVVAGNLLAQWAGLSLWGAPGNSLPIFAVRLSTLTTPITYSSQALIVVLRPLAAAFLATVAALALADARQTRRPNRNEIGSKTES